MFLLPPFAQNRAGEVRAWPHGARLLQVPERVLQGVDQVPRGGGEAEGVGERREEEKSERGSCGKKLRGKFLPLPRSRTAGRGEEHLK